MPAGSRIRRQGRGRVWVGRFCRAACRSAPLRVAGPPRAAQPICGACQARIRRAPRVETLLLSRPCARRRRRSGGLGGSPVRAGGAQQAAENGWAAGSARFCRRGMSRSECTLGLPRHDKAVPRGPCRVVRHPVAAQNRLRSGAARRRRADTPACGAAARHPHSGHIRLGWPGRHPARGRSNPTLKPCALGRATSLEAARAISALASSNAAPCVLVQGRTRSSVEPAGHAADSSTHGASGAPLTPDFITCSQH